MVVRDLPKGQSKISRHSANAEAVFQTGSQDQGAFQILPMGS